MPPTQAAAQTGKTIRLIHAAMISGVVLFGFLTLFVLRRDAADFGDLPPNVVRLLLVVAVGACVGALALRTRVPRGASDEPADLFWRRAIAPALITWAALEGAGLIGVVVYLKTGSPSAIGIAAVAVVISMILNPGYLERH